MAEAMRAGDLTPRSHVVRTEYVLGGQPPAVVLPTDDRVVCEAVTAFRDHRGRLWRSADELLRHGDGHTHRVCPGCLAVVVPRSHGTLCSSCRAVRDRTRWERLPRTDWTAETPIVELDGDTYVFDEDELCVLLEDRLVRAGDSPPLFVTCERAAWRAFDVSDLVDSLCVEDSESVALPRGVEEMVAAANALLAEHPPSVWQQAPPNRLRAVDVTRWMPTASAGGGS
jgi:hypothetical protein